MPAAPPPPVTPRIPGESGIWVVVLGDLFVFALLFGTVGYDRMGDPALFHAGAAQMNRVLGLVNTLALLTSSLCVARAIEAVRARHPDAARRWIAGAGALGVLFVAIKAGEYHEKAAAGFWPDTDIFFTLYYVLTGMHLVHVLVGLVALALMYRGVARARTAAEIQLIECGAVFWHLVDVLWVFLFAIFYLHR